MAFGIEGRVPFLDHRLVRYAIALGDDQKIAAGQAKVALRRAMRGVVPFEILARRGQDRLPDAPASVVRTDVALDARHPHE